MRYIISFLVDEKKYDDIGIGNEPYCKILIMQVYVPLMVLNIIMFVVSDHLQFLFNQYKKIELTKRVNVENTVR